MTTIAITGINSYFAKTVLPKLQADAEIERIIGIDIAPFSGSSEKVIFHQGDVRGTQMKDWLSGADMLMHLAFIVQEIHDKKKTHDINVEGTKNVLQAAVKNGIRKIVYTSSIAAYGAHPDNPIGITEDFRIKANEDSYYSSDKVAVETYLREFTKTNPDISLTVFRPPVILGPRISNFAVDLFRKKAAFFIKGINPEVQYLHEDDLGEALYLAVKKDVPGIYNIAADDHMPARRTYEIAGVKLKEMSAGMLKFLANVSFALRLEKFSQGWVSLMEYPVVVNSEKFKKATGWQPKYNSEEAFRLFVEAIK
jgi:UDP-glucose 4-epimerase